MRAAKIRRWARSLILAAAVALPSGGNLVLPVLTTGIAASTLVAPAPAEARTSSRSSSGGYSRPSRTPSFSGRSSGLFDRTPSTSGGYRRPSDSGGGGFFGAPSGGDTAMSRRGSAEALQRYRNQQQPSPPPSTGSGGTGRPLDGTGGGWTTRRPSTYDWGGGGWRVPSYAYRAPSSFGVWDAMFLWFMLDSLSNASHAAWFHNHQDDTGYRQWRAEADRLAQDNAELRHKLDKLDQELAQQQGKPRDPNYLPPDVTSSEAMAGQPGREPARALGAPEQPGGGGSLVLVIVVIGGAAFLFWMWKKRTAPKAAAASGPKGALGTAADILRHKVSGEGYKPTLFRVGMIVTLDPTPFLLASGKLKTPAPTLSGSVDIQAVGTVSAAGTALSRLYLPDGKSFLQLHLDAADQPDECRYFTVIDEVTPATEEEWGFWIDPGNGMIGWPEFETKDGTPYSRVWSPGSSRVPPLEFSETINETDRMRVLNGRAMLYGRTTGATAPAPQTEYLLVAMIEEGGQAWIEIRAGIDVNPASLSLT